MRELSMELKHRVIKLFLTGSTFDEIAAQLDALATAVAEGEDVSWGQVANEVTSKGQYRHQDQEQNENVDGNDEPEQEKNDHNNGKKDDHHVQGKKK